MEREPSEPTGGRDAKSRARRAELTARIADLLLTEGVAQIPLRELAAKLGTSDRMLLYYFEDKADLVRAAIAELSARMGAMLAVSFTAERRPPALVMTAVADFLLSPAVTPFMNVWADISARGGRGEALYQAMAADSVRDSLAWLDSQLAIDDEPARRAAASAILAVVEGVRMIERAAPGSTEGVTDLLAGSFAAGVDGAPT